MSARRRLRRVAGLSPAQIAALVDADAAGVIRIPAPTARVLADRFGYLELADEPGAWAITDRGRGAAAVLAAVSRRRPADNPGLSVRRPYRETASVADAVCRLIGAVGRRAAEEDTEGLRLLMKLDAAVQDALATAVEGLRGPYTDGEIGAAIGVRKQAVQKRWPRTKEGSP